MDEKILIKGRINQKIKNFLQKAPLILLAIAVFFAILLSFEYKFESTNYYGQKVTRTDTGWYVMFWGRDDTFIFFIMFLLGVLSLISSIVIGIIYLVNRNCELIITENNVKGKSILGKEVVLPLYMVSAHATRKFLSVITIATSSGLTRFALIENYKEIGEVLTKKINEIQQNTETITVQQPSNNSSMDDLVKLKTLLDSGIISQEEFEAKKKQILNI